MKKDYSTPSFCLMYGEKADFFTASFTQQDEGIGDSVNFDDLL